MTRIERAFAPVQTQAALSGTVRSTDGNAIAGARVCAACAGCTTQELPPSACTLTDASGGYGLTARGLRAVVISAIADGFDLGYARDGAPLMTRQEPQVGLDIVLAPGGARLSGVVVDALGGPVPNARIVLEKHDQALRSVLETQSDDEGHFQLASPPGFVTLRAQQDGYAPESKGVVAPASDVTLQLTPASTVRGRVVARGTGEPVADVEVSALLNGFPAQTAPALSDDEGSFVLSGLEPGRYVFLGTSEHHRGTSDGMLEVRLADNLDGVVVTVDPALRVLGHVEQQGKDGRTPCTRGVVSLDPVAVGGPFGTEARGAPGRNSIASIEPDGSARFPGVLPGRYDVDVRCAEHVLATGPKVLEVTGEDLEVTWTVRQGLALTVHVVDALGNPVPKASMFLLSERADRPQEPIATSLTADAKGNASVHNELTPGKYTVQPADGTESASASVVLQDGSPPAELTLRLPGSAAVVLLARDEAGKPVSNLIVSASAAGEASAATPGAAAPSLPPTAGSAPPPMPALRLQRRALEEGAGRYRIGPLQPGEYEVRVEDGVNPSWTVPGGNVRVVSGSTLELQTVIARGGVVRGTVVDQLGNPEANAWVSASPEGERPSDWSRHLTMTDPPARVMTDADGHFELTGLRTASRYTIKVKQPYDNAAVQHGVLEGQTVRIVLPSSGSVAGIVRDAQGQPVPGAQVTAHERDTATARTTMTKRDGSFFLERIPAGNVVLQAGHSALGFTELALALEPGQRALGHTLTFPAPAENGAHALPGRPMLPSAPGMIANEPRQQPSAPGG